MYLQSIVRGPSKYWNFQLPSKEVLPIDANVRHGLGLWVGVAHIVKEHPIFNGLPSNQMMDQNYENVWSPQGIEVEGAERIVTSISHGFYGGDEDNQHHQGPEPAWNAIDLGLVNYGNGQFVLNSLRIIENLWKDPVADKIFYNLIQWTSK